MALSSPHQQSGNTYLIILAVTRNREVVYPGQQTLIDRAKRSVNYINDAFIKCVNAITSNFSTPQTEQAMDNSPLNALGDFQFQEITSSDVAKAIKSLSLAASVGVDGIKVSELKTSCDEISPTLAYIFN